MIILKMIIHSYNQPIERLENITSENSICNPSNFDILSPLDQFQIRDFISVQGSLFGNNSLSLTNISLYLMIACVLIIMLSIFSNNDNLIPNS